MAFFWQIKKQIGPLTAPRVSTQPISEQAKTDNTGRVTFLVYIKGEGHGTLTELESMGIIGDPTVVAVRLLLVGRNVDNALSYLNDVKCRTVSFDDNTDQGWTRTDLAQGMDTRHWAEIGTKAHFYYYVSYWVKGAGDTGPSSWLELHLLRGLPWLCQSRRGMHDSQTRQAEESASMGSTQHGVPIFFVFNRPLHHQWWYSDLGLLTDLWSERVTGTSWLTNV